MKKILLILALLLISNVANAATCFWVGGTGTWSTILLISWASSSGGTPSTCAATGGVPKQAGDVATFDASSGGGTVTVDSSISGATIATLNTGAFTGTFDNSANNANLTITSQWNNSNTGTRTIKCGTATYTLSGNNINILDNSTVTGLTWTCSSAIFVIASPGSSSTQTFAGGGQTYGTVTVNSRTNASIASITGNNTYGTLNISAPAHVTFPFTAGTVTNAINWSGTSSAASQLVIAGSAGTASITVAATSQINWAALRGMLFSGTTVTCGNCFDAGGNTGVTITQPGGGTNSGHIIGG